MESHAQYGLKRGAPPPAAPPSLATLNSGQREAFEARMDAQAASAAEAANGGLTLPRVTARSCSVESGTYDFYGETGTLEDLSWMYDRKAVEFEEPQEQGTYDMFF